MASFKSLLLRCGNERLFVLLSDFSLMFPDT
jgi:hypothetical protein